MIDRSMRGVGLGVSGLGESERVSVSEGSNKQMKEKYHDIVSLPSYSPSSPSQREIS